MTTGKVLNLYMTMPDMMRSGHRQRVADFECDPRGIMGDKDYESENGMRILLVSKKSYDIIEEAELVVDMGMMMENIYVDIDINHLKAGSLIEIGDVIFEVTGPCEAYNYLYGFDPDLPELIHGNRGVFIQATELGRVEMGDPVSILKEA